jgi:hypothetical protein
MPPPAKRPQASAFPSASTQEWGEGWNN